MTRRSSKRSGFSERWLCDLAGAPRDGSFARLGVLGVERVRGFAGFLRVALLAVCLSMGAVAPAVTA